MNRNLSLVLVVAAAACGLALAQAPKANDASQLGALQKKVEALEAEVLALKKVKPTDVEAAVVKSRETLDAIVEHLKAQSSASEKLQAVLADSREKGFTFGINPDSRTVLLQGFHEFAESLKNEISLDAPAPVVAPKR